MFNATFNKTILSTLAAAIVATGLSLNPAMAGGGGGGNDRAGHNKAKTDWASSTHKSGKTITSFAKKGSKTRTVVTTQDGQLVNVRKVKKNGVPFISMTDENGNVSIVAGKPKRSKIPFVTLHNADGTSHTIAGTPQRSAVPSITLHHADGTSTTLRGDR